MSAALWSCPNAGSSSAPLRGSIAAAAWLKTGSASTERPWHSYASHQFASCSENFAIRPEVSGQTLRAFLCPSEASILLYERFAPPILTNPRRVSPVPPAPLAGQRDDVCRIAAVGADGLTDHVQFRGLACRHD